MLDPNFRPVGKSPRGSCASPSPLVVSQVLEVQRRNPQGLRQNLPDYSGCWGAWRRPEYGEPPGRTEMQALSHSRPLLISGYCQNNHNEI